MRTSIGVEKHPFLHVEIRSVPVSQAIVWLRAGLDDLKDTGFTSYAHGVLIAVLGAILLMMASSHLFLVVAAVSSYLLVGPVMTSGPCELSRRRAAHERLGFDDSLDAMSRNPQGLLQFGAILATIAVVWSVLSGVILDTLPHAALSLNGVLWGGFTDAVSKPQLIAYVSSGAVFAIIVFTLSVVAIPLIIDRHATAAEAMWASIRCTFRNLPVMLVWAALIVGLTAIGFLTMLVGMIIVAPLLGHATWHAYKDLIR
jgi:uncharacterized membrane protein